MTYGNAKPLTSCALCLRKCGIGLPKIAKYLRVGKATVSRWLAEHAIPTRPNKASVQLCERRGLRSVLSAMRYRVKRCLNKKPPKPPRVQHPTFGMTEAERFRWRYHNIPEARLYELLRRRMKKVIKEGVKRGRSLELVGCTTEHLRAHIEAQFEVGMDWKNMGTGHGLWHIDHRIPCAAFDLTREDQQRICFHWTNLRPMWSLLNIAKGKKLEAHATPCFL